MSRSARLKGHTHPSVDPEFTVSTVARRVKNRSASATCAVTGESVDLRDPHYYVTFRKPVDDVGRPDEFAHLVVAIDALEELETVE